MNVSSRLRPTWAAACLLTLAGALGAAALPALAAERGPLRKAAAAPVETEARIIVKFKADSGLMRPLSANSGTVLPQHAQALSARMGLSLSDGRVIGTHAQVLKAQGMSSRDLADRVAAQSDVEYAVVDGRMRALAAPNDTFYGPGQTLPMPVVGQWYLRAPTSTTIVDATSVLASINAEPAWGITPGSSSVVVAVLDTGVRRDHPDLTSKLLAGYDFITSATVSNDGDGRDTDPSDPGDYGCATGEATSTWHGTQTAGLIGAATNNGAGMASIGRNVMVLPVRVLGVCGGYDSDIQAGMLWAGGLSTTPAKPAIPARVINLSLGSAAACSTAYRDVVSQLNNAGVVVVAAAGNDGLTVGSPANCAGVIAVAGVRHAGTKVGYSDLGAEVAIAAPAGNCVNTSGACLFPLITTSNSGTTTPVTGTAGAIYTDGGADASLGTSFSAPLVSGTVGLMLSTNPALTPAQVRTALQATARPFPASGAPPVDNGNGHFVPVTACTAPTSVAQNSECYCTTATCGAGLLDAGAAVTSVAAVTANISVASTLVVVGNTVALDGSASRGSDGGSSNLSYRWAITSGGGLASITSSTTAATATLATTGTGTVIVSLTVIDGTGRQATGSVTLGVVTPPVITPTPAPASDSGGGGAMELGWLLGWLASVIGVWVVTPRRPTH